MTVTLARYRARQKETIKYRLRRLDEEAWKSIRGIWKDKAVNPVTYQRKLRQEADADVL